MEKITLAKLDSDLYYEKLDNGLQVLLLPNHKKKSYYMTYGVWFGSFDVEFTPKNEKKMIKVPDGIAHFLEHKMFEQEDGLDPFTFFSKSGSGANASTTFDGTQYLCYGNQELLPNLEFLLNYVNSPYFTDENVEKEKGIITQEIKMYDDIPEWFLQKQLRFNLFHEYPIKYDIAGTVESINKTTKEDLYRCYNTFYQPDNMFLIITGNMNVEEVIELVRENQKNKTTSKGIIKTKKYKEQDSVFKEKEEFYMNVKIPKVGYAFKINREKSSIKEDYLFDYYLTMLTTLLLGSTSSFREKIRDKKLTNDFYYEFDGALNYRTLMILSETIDPDSFLKDLKEEFSNMSFDKADFERIKKVWIASEVQMIDDITTSADNLYSDMLRYHKFIPDKVDKIRSMNFETLKKMINEIDFSNTSEIIIYPKKNDK